MADPKNRSAQTAPILEIEGARAPKADDSHDPYMRVPEADRQRTPGQRTDLRKLSAWIKMMRSLEEAKRHREEDE